ncbi:MAG: DUF1028 domain-containing protein [Candidatus Methanofastidiosa archaeon]|nr:DUF1028 domain-containing protein [Candidatus Methanofastidiosa archaeon]
MTYSIVAMDRRAGLMGVGVQSHYFSVGSVVPWTRSGVGVVATQAMVNVSYGPKGLDLIALGLSPMEALECLIDDDSCPEARQVALLDAKGDVHAHTGSSCIPEAGHHIGDGFSCQANMMGKDTVWDAMADAYEASEGKALDVRILKALEAAEAEGGDIRGMQSAAIVICTIERSEEPWQDKIMDLRVEDSDRPLEELGRLLKTSKAYKLADEGEDLMGKGDAAGAFELYKKASGICPDNIEIKFWRAVTLSQAGEDKEAKALFKSIFIQDPRWGELLIRLCRCGMFDEEKAKGILEN